MAGDGDTFDPAPLVEALRPIRLPVDYAVLGPRDALAAFALGVIAALVLVLLLRPLLARRVDPVAEAAARIAALAQAPAEARLVGLARLLAAAGPDAPRPPGLDDVLYAPGTAPDFAAIEAEILARAAQQGRRRRAPGTPSRDGSAGSSGAARYDTAAGVTLPRVTSPRVTSPGATWPRGTGEGTR
ncbi:hypothetical protein [Acuticoccus yangtzensis]|uniref:hypothetical protein n=1 Tax=Acuticoccus yangtzensis TaxID=1443441 RepID=UPI000949A53F|nr:hypothetical protein [Acuticoccus yangtzensis]